jgi:hypothetical protein
VLSIIVILIWVGLRLRERSGSATLQLAVPAGQPQAIQSRPGPDSGSASAVAASDGVEVCGVGKVKLDIDDPRAVGEYLGGLTHKTEVKWKSALINSDDYRARAVGLFMQQRAFAGKTAILPVEHARDELVQLATGVNDPAVYAIALQMCRTGFSEPATTDPCARLSLANWARIDSDNAAPWLALAWKAQDDGDASAERADIGRAAVAHRIDYYGDSLLSFAQLQVPPDVTPLELDEMDTELMGFEAAWWRPVRAATKHCSPDAMRQSKVQQDCNALANLMVKDGRTLIDMSIGKLIGERAGWSKERVDALTEESNALRGVSIVDYGDLWDCNSVDAQNALFGRIKRLGELGALREMLDQSSHSSQEMAQKYLDFMDKAAQEAQRLDAAGAESPYPSADQ